MSKRIRTDELISWVELASSLGIEEVSFPLDAETHEDSDAMILFFGRLHSMCMDGNIIQSLCTNFGNTVTKEGYFNHVDIKIGLIQ